MKNNKTQKLVYASLFAALIFAATQFIRLPLPFGYFNLGDCFVILSAVILGGPYAVMSAAVGSVLADLLSGYAVYVPATLVIKSLVVIVILTFLKLHKNKAPKLPILIVSFVAAESVMVLLYFTYDIILYSFNGAIMALGGNLMQGAASVVTSAVIVVLLEKSGIMKRIKIK